MISDGTNSTISTHSIDANPNTDTTEKFQKINRAYQTLSDTRRRRRYNSQMYNHGFSDDTPNFIIDSFEDGSQPLRPKSTATTDAIPYQPNQLEPNNNGRGSLLKNNKDEDGKGTDGAYRIRCLWKIKECTWDDIDIAHYDPLLFMRTKPIEWKPRSGAEQIDWIFIFPPFIMNIIVEKICCSILCVYLLNILILETQQLFA